MQTNYSRVANSQKHYGGNLCFGPHKRKEDETKQNKTLRYPNKVKRASLNLEQCCISFNYVSLQECVEYFASRVCWILHYGKHMPNVDVYYRNVHQACGIWCGHWQLSISVCLRCLEMKWTYIICNGVLLYKGSIGWTDQPICQISY